MATIPTSLASSAPVSLGETDGTPRDAAETRTGTRPPLKTLDGYLHNLPVLRAPLVGRERELADARALLLREDLGALTLTGAGGSGKTRLALQLAVNLVDHFPDGAFFVPLASITDPALVLPTTAQALGLREDG